MLVGNISLDQVLGVTEIATPGVSAGEEQGVSFGSLITGPLQGNPEEVLNNPVFKSLILKGLQNGEVSEQIKNVLASGGKISLEINNPKDILAGLLNMAQELNINTEAVSGEEVALNVNVEELLNSIDVKEVVVENQQIQEVLGNFSQKLTELLQGQIEKIENSNIERKEELIQFVDSLFKDLDIVDVACPDQLQIDLSNINIEDLSGDELEIAVDNPESDETSVTPITVEIPVIPITTEMPITSETQQVIEPIQLVEAPQAEDTLSVSDTPELIMDPVAQVAIEQPVSESTAPPVSQEMQKMSALDAIKNALTQIFEKVIDKVNSRQDTKVVLNNSGMENVSAKSDEKLIEKFGLLKNIDLENFKEIDVKIALNPSVVNKLEANLNKFLVDVKQVLNQELNGKELNLDSIAESLKTNLEAIVNSAKQLSSNNDIKVVIPKSAFNAEIIPVFNKETLQPQPIDQEIVNIEKLEVPKLKPEVVKTSQVDKSLELSKFISFKPTESISLPPKEKDNLLDALIDKNIGGLGIERPKSDAGSGSNLFQNNSTSQDRNLFSMMLDNQSDPAISGLKAANSVFASRMSPLNAAPPSITADSAAGQLINKIREGFGRNQISLALNPNNLGSVNVNVTMQRGVLVASIIAETSKAFDSLKSGADSLRSALVESGLNVDRVVVAQADQSSGASNNNNNDSKNNSLKDHSQNAQDQQNNKDTNQEKAKEFKDKMEFFQFKQAQKPASLDKTLARSTINQSIVENNTIQTAKNKDNYINKDKGFVDYRV